MINFQEKSRAKIEALIKEKSKMKGLPTSKPISIKTFLNELIDQDYNKLYWYKKMAKALQEERKRLEQLVKGENIEKYYCLVCENAANCDTKPICDTFTFKLKKKEK